MPKAGNVITILALRAINGNMKIQMERLKDSKNADSEESAFYLIKLDQVEYQREKNKRKCKPFGHLCKLGIESLCLALGEEGLSAAGDRAGQTCALTALHKHDNGDSKTGDNLKNSEDNGERRHLFQSFRFYTILQPVKYNIPLSTIQAFFSIYLTFLRRAQFGLLFPPEYEREEAIYNICRYYQQEGQKNGEHNGKYVG